MVGKLTDFTIRGLHGRRTVALKLSDNRLILVGENGTGKTTVINILYYFLSRQWRRLANYEFASIEATFNDNVYELPAEWLSGPEWIAEPGLRRMRHFPPHMYDQVIHMIEREGPEPSPAAIHMWSSRLGFPPSVLREVIAEYTHQPKRQELVELGEAIKREVPSQVLYLPTYRRIEQDLKSIFPGLDESDFRRRVSKRVGRGAFVELVEFGMEDVENAVAEKMAQLKERVRTGLDSLTTAYLRDVIGGEYKSLSAESIQPEELEGIEAVFGRIDERTLPTTAKDKLREIVEKIQKRQWVDDDQKVIAWFLLKLLDLHRRQQEAEEPVRQFVAICNEYLVGKPIRFDSSEFSISLQVEGISTNSDAALSDGQQISFRDLSSGEKQIVSLFSHLLLVGGPGFFVLIDEPELSLSVPWQSRFLPDVISTGRCDGIVAVTHSPFVFDNELDPYAHNIAEFSG